MAIDVVHKKFDVILCRMYPMLLYALRLFITPTGSLIRHAIYTGPPRRVDCLAAFWEYRRTVSFPRTE